MASSDATPFDELAADYDASFTHSACGRNLRARVWQRATRVFAGRGRILELGCGTGEDAVHLARAGHHVVATDASTGMIRIARLKAAAAGVGSRIDFHVLPVESLDELGREARFDAVFSNFGAINCVADIPRLARALGEHLAPGAPLLFVVMGRHVPWEWAWYLARGDRVRAFRRYDRDGVAWRGLTIRYPTPRELTRALAPTFTTRRRAALGCALPPSYAARWLDRSPRSLAALSAVENVFARVAAGVADHFVIEATRASPLASP
jgi:SAM-dependent methyltransferase